MAPLHIPFDETHAKTSQMHAFLNWMGARAHVDFRDYHSLQRWACDNFQDFWRAFLTWADVPTSGNPNPVHVGKGIEDGRFFPELRLNYVQCLLRVLPDVPDDASAVSYRSENGESRQLTRAGLRSRVLAIAAALQAEGLKPGDRAVAFARNTPETLEACLAATALGATWSSVGVDLSADAVVARFGQLEPSVLFVHTDSLSQGVERSLHETVQALVSRLPTLRLLVVLDDRTRDAPAVSLPAVSLERLAEHAPLSLDRLPHFPFDHPLFVLFTSGTTGAPKCLVHGAGGTLLEHLKEHRLHSDFRFGDRLYFHTSCGWMMWNWQLTALASGVSILLYDGSVSHPDLQTFLGVLREESITVFGTSPAYIQVLRQAGLRPKDVAQFPALRLIQSTGSILYDEQFSWIGEAFKPVPIHSICGGSDIMGCFFLGNPLLPVYTGESQCVSLGMDVRVWTEAGIEATGTGELVCRTPFPSRPVRIWGDENGQRFHDSYFAQHESLWTHGDLVSLSTHGTARILGRCDGTMKIRGVRIGPAELYAVVLTIPGIREAMAVEQEDRQQPGGRRIVLLVVLASGAVLDRQLTLRIKRELNQRASPLHVPSAILAVTALPQTHNGKYSERAAHDVINGRTPKNVSALRNPECLFELRRLSAQLHNQKVQ